MEHPTRCCLAENTSIEEDLEVTEEIILDEEKADKTVLDIANQHNVEQLEPIDVVAFDSTDYFTINKTFDSRKEVIEGVFGIQKNIVVVIVKTVNKNENQGVKGLSIVFGCEKGGKYKKGKQTSSPSKCRKRTGTKRCKCPFKLRSTCITASKWNLVLKVGHHNHPHPDELLGHAFVGRLTKNEEKYVIYFHEHDMPPR
ncbi:uncharacterized protein LOC113290439 [Papaver somniferum]|uniref:uncharacterized protein LOC113290439 n=1 Tax=Papaver somniferum TaxID=3469 RepID=UPI000E703C22|nr:uncharacterized protein LOC113290439 [Papaver somniferum]